MDLPELSKLKDAIESAGLTESFSQLSQISPDSQVPQISRELPGCDSTVCQTCVVCQSGGIF